MAYKAADLNLLLPSFRTRAQSVLDKMTARGFKPIPFCTLRTPAQAVANSKKGTGIVKSMHLYGCAVDVICADHGWACSTKKGGDHGFFTALGEEAKATGSVWGGDWNGNDVQDEHDTDLVHFQGVDASPAAQNAMRALGVGDEHAADRDALVKAHYAKIGK